MLYEVAVMRVDGVVADQVLQVPIEAPTIHAALAKVLSILPVNAPVEEGK